MSLKKRFSLHLYYIKNGFIFGVIAGLLYVTFEAIFSDLNFSGTIYLIIRGIINGALIGIIIGTLEIMLYDFYREQKFLISAMIRSIIFTLAINFLLTISNTIYYVYQFNYRIDEAITIYIQGESYLYNFIYTFIIAFIIVAIIQIDKLHRRHELLNFILGKYNLPKEEELIFLFVDLKRSTKLAEQLGNFKYGNFLKDYYSDISDAISRYGGDVYQYVGDEIIIFWKKSEPEKNILGIRCYFMIQKIFSEKTIYYQSKYGVIPSYRGSIHGGKVLITWVGEVKKEILFIGDTLNTAARIQEICKESEKSLLISGYILDNIKLPEDYMFPYENQFVPRGKKQMIQVFSVENKTS